MFDSLLSKTLFVTGAQVALTYASTCFLIGRFRTMYLDIDEEAIKPPFWILLGADLFCFLVLLF